MYQHCGCVTLHQTASQHMHKKAEGDNLQQKGGNAPKCCPAYVHVHVYSTILPCMYMYMYMYMYSVCIHNSTCINNCYCMVCINKKHSIVIRHLNVLRVRKYMYHETTGLFLKTQLWLEEMGSRDKMKSDQV